MTPGDLGRNLYPVAAGELAVPQWAGGPPAETPHENHSPAVGRALVNCAASAQLPQFYSRTLQRTILSILFSVWIYSVLSAVQNYCTEYIGT